MRLATDYCKKFVGPRMWLSGLREVCQDSAICSRSRPQNFENCKPYLIIW